MNQVPKVMVMAEKSNRTVSVDLPMAPGEFCHSNLRFGMENSGLANKTDDAETGWKGFLIRWANRAKYAVCHGTINYSMKAYGAMFSQVHNSGT